MCVYLSEYVQYVCECVEYVHSDVCEYVCEHVCEYVWSMKAM